MITAIELNEYVQLTRRAVAKIAKQVAAEEWGYGHCLTEDDELILEYMYAVTLLRNQSLYGDVCLCDAEVESIKSGIHRILGPECSVVNKDFTRERRPDADRWILQNPYCIAYDYALDYILAQCNRIGLDIKLVEKNCADVGVKLDIVNPVICDAIDIALDVKEQKCDIDLELNVNLHQCITDFELQIKPLNCGVDFKTFVTAINCGANVDLILNKINCAADVKLTPNEVVASLCNAPIEDPAVCTFSYDCTLLECDDVTLSCPPFFVGTADYLGIPTFNVQCGDCNFTIHPGYWDISTNYDVNTVTHILTFALGESPVGAGLSCLEGENASFYWASYYAAFCKADCDMVGEFCEFACLGDPACIDQCLTTQSICNDACLTAAFELDLNTPTPTCCASDYSAQLVLTLSNVYEDLIVCEGTTGGYFEGTWEFTDSLGNTASCAARAFNTFC